MYGVYTYKRCASMEISAAFIEEILCWRVRMVETTLMASQFKISERVRKNVFSMQQSKNVSPRKTIKYHLAFLSIVSALLHASTI